MIKDLIILEGYGFFVWSAFIFSILSCCFLYLKTRKDFQMQEKIYLDEIKQQNALKIQVTGLEATTKEVLSSSTN